ncbi:MAG: class I SAM-dependent methyltransferase [Thermodesulfobacteriota bacterium]
MLERGPRSEILQRIDSKGPITFAEFMEVALYSDDGGYYTSCEGIWGESGDYITSIDVSPVFSRVLAVAVTEMWEKLGSPGDFVLLEAGAGRGFLSTGVLSALEVITPELYDVISVELVEKNANLRQAASDKVLWRDELPGPGSIKKGVIISNELIDSFPFHRVSFDGRAVSEIYVGRDGDELIDTEGPLSREDIGRYLEETGVEFIEGQRAEVNMMAGPWIKQAAAILKSGFVITIDYGLPVKELYGVDRMGGTLMCHYRHKSNFTPYERIGSQDITSHVDFTHLYRKGQEAGLKLSGFTTQKNFLLGLGILEELVDTGEMSVSDYEKVKYNRAIAGLIAPGGMGDIFKVLVQYKGGGTEGDAPVLKGFSFRDMSRYL